MRWIPGTSGRNVEDRRGTRMGFGGGMGRMGIGGIILVAILSFVFKQDFFALLGSANGSGVTTTEGPIQSSPAEDSLKDMVTFVLNDAQTVWTQALPVQARTNYRDARLVLFRDAVESACGQAGASTGPFYCPGDEKIYIDLGFYQELENRFGASGDFAQAYVLAHEIGHHVQNILGVLGQGGRSNQQSVGVELQADCFAGVWASTARERRLLDPGDVEEGLAAASAVGDDRIQQMSGRAVNPESWTHGSAQQRSAAFRRGFDSGQMQSCTSGF
jgi:predicted metalloprotease